MAPSPTIRRLLKETSELSSTSKNPNPAFHAGPVSDTDLHEWHFTLLGPPAPSPYAGGLYHGRISLPPSYPLKPPNFRFLTPSGRFEVNREICLSISGFHEETWMPAWGVRTALTALRSFMAESGTAGQVGGLEAAKEVRERLAKESRVWRCKECGSRTNEEIMSEWWETCAQKGVKVGEDIGLEVLPEGLSLEAKVPSRTAEGAEQEKPKEQVVLEKVAKATTQAILHGEDAPDEDEVKEIVKTVDTFCYKNKGKETSTLEPHSAADISTSPTSNQHLAQSQIPTQEASDTSSTPPRPQHQPTSSMTATPEVDRPTTSAPRPLPIVNPAPASLQPARYPQQHQNARVVEEVTTVTIDRAIYIVFLALFIMILKKIFYPAGEGGFWGDGAVVRK